MKITHKTSKYSEGFTIIETMIVLAIAALIMLIVFLAVPALQQAQRNSARKNDASRIAAAVSTFVSNANGNLPCQSTGSFVTTSTTPNDAQTIINQAGKLGQYTISNYACTVTAATLFASGTFNITNLAPVFPSSYSDNELVLFESATCSGNTAVTSTNPRTAALVYTVGIGSSSYGTSCYQAL